MRLFANKNQRIVAIISLIINILVFMAFMPYASFDPSTMGFWMAIVNAVVLIGSINLFLTYYHDKEVRKKTQNGQE